MLAANVNAYAKSRQLICSMKRKRRLVLLFCIIFALALYFLLASFISGSPSAGTNILLIFSASLPSIILELILLTKIMLPATTSFTIECDPEKFLLINQEIKRTAHPPHVASTLGHFFLGDFDAAQESASNTFHAASASYKPYKLTALFYKASCEYMQGMYSRADHTIRNFNDLFSHSSDKLQRQYTNTHLSLLLLQAIMQLDIEKINQYRTAERQPTSAISKPAEGWLSYLRGVAAFHVQDYEHSFQYFSSLMQGYEKTFLPQAAAEYIEKLKPLLHNSKFESYNN